MKLPKLRRETTVSGLGTQENTAKLLILVLAPFYILYFGTYYLIEMNYVEETFGIMIFFVGLAIEISAMYGYNAKKQKDAAEHLSFPASLWRFNSTDKTLIDLFIPPPRGIRYIGEFTKSSVEELCKEIKKVIKEGKPKNPNRTSGNNPNYVYLIENKHAIEYEHPQFGPLIFNRFIWICPSKFEETFLFTPGGETWYGNFPVTHPKSEGLVLHVIDWHNHMGEYMPICIVADSTRHYEQSLERVKIPNPEYEQIVSSKLSFLREENIALKDQVSTLEDHLNAVLKRSYKASELVRKQLEDIKTWLGDVTRETPPLRYRLLNLKTFGAILIVLFIIYLAWTYMGG
ncbi:hypothetical protein DRO69_02015 [Candidatus Bathyarchaeota archaeon]|nr:MAG: hypothetical protein DRO69_02015 [Candidatus Bathyarchaeota archaeon]